MDFVCVAATSSCQGEAHNTNGFRSFFSQPGSDFSVSFLSVGKASDESASDGTSVDGESDVEASVEVEVDSDVGVASDSDTEAGKAEGDGFAMAS